ncbi:MAG: 4Fe-4S binding protein [Planctomycetaceae bacterium]|jgi:polyferredoxin|nr:4Fe-4S binding protein [Planctomycetaceae bacterium]
MLKLLRVSVALIVFTALSALFLDFTGTVPNGVHWLAHLQFVPAIKMLPFVLLGWLIITLLFGRIYCSVMCPFGILQDGIARIAKLIRRKKAKYQFRPEMYKTRRLLLLLFIIGIAALPVVVSLLDPYSNFGRLMEFVFRPVYLTGNNVLAGFIPNSFRYQYVRVEFVPFAVAFAVFLFAGVLSFFYGRRYCNTVCPVGTLLGLFAKFAPVRIRLNSQCVSCGLCEKVCKGECIGSKRKTVDVSRCVECFNCLNVCKQKAVGFTYNFTNNEPAAPLPVKPETGETSSAANATQRRNFIQGAILALFGVKTAETFAQGLPTGESRVAYKNPHPVLPPGAKSRGHLIHHCTACQLCVAKCPSNVLTPSVTDLGIRGFLVPVAKFEHGFCNYDCTICTQVCPTAALMKIDTVAEKHKLQIGNVVFLKENCVVHTQNTNCGACAEHCPTGALSMRPYGPPGSTLTIPEVSPDLCVGCGACESICPVRPYRAVYVAGLKKHGEAKPAFDPNEKQQEVQLDSFGF